MNDGQKLSEATTNAFTGILTETASEYSGSIFSMFPNAVKQQLIKAGILKSLLTKNKGVATQKVLQLIKKAGWNGVFEEMGEEQVGNVMYGTLHALGLSDQNFHFPTGKELATQLLTFSLMGTAMHTVANTYGQIVGDKMQEEMSPKTKEVLKLSKIM
jgi:hypothetical protein